MTDNVQTRLAALSELRLPELQARFAEIVGEETRCPNRTFLLRRIAETLGAEAPELAAASEPDAPTEACEAAPSSPPEAASEAIDAADPSEAETEVAPAVEASEAEAVPTTSATDALANDPEIDALRARYVAVVGRPTGSRDKRYLLWKIRLASQGKVPVGPVGRRSPGEPAVEHKVLPLRMPAETVEALDDVWRRRGLKSRMELFRHALDQYLSGLGEAAAAARVRGV
jgi:hypothetical protein